MKRWRLDRRTGAALAAAAWVLGTCAGAEAGPAQGPDLVVTDIAPSNANPPAGGTIDVVATVLNQGSADATDAFDVDLFRNSAARPNALSTPDDTEAATVPLVAGKTTTVTFAGITNASAETWNMWVYVDRVDTVDEPTGGEGNNVAGPEIVTWGGGALQPDLKIIAITPSDPSPAPGTPISVSVTVNNAGNADASSFRLDLFTNPASPPVVGDQATDPAPLTGLSLAKSTEQSFEFTGVVSATDATWQMYAVVDTVQAVDEKNEDNNVYGPEPLVWGTAASLRLDSPDGGEVWETGTVRSITWTSIGGVGDNVTLEYSTDGGTSVWKEIIASTVNDGEYEWTVPDDPSANCVVRVSSTTTAHEDASDDVFTIQAAAAAKPDLKVLAVTPSNSNPSVGTPIDVLVTVVNQGDGDAGFFTVDLFEDRGTPPAVGESEGLTESVASLGAGLSTQVVFSGLTSAVAATWHTYAIVDTGSFIDESNEDNNVGGPVLVGWGGGVATVTVTSPNGAEVLEAGEVHDITWTADGSPGPPYHIEYTVNNGSTWIEVVGTTFNADSYSWTVPASASTMCRVLVANTTGSVSDISDGLFEIRTVPELAVLSIVPSDAHPIAGERISIGVVVENRGTADAGEFAVALFENAASQPTVGSPPDSSLTVPSLDAGAQATVTFEDVTSGAAGVWSAYAAADNGAAVAEKDESNNVAGPSTVRWHARPWLGTGCSAGWQEGEATGFALTSVLPLLGFLAVASMSRRSAGASIARPERGERT